MAVLKAHHILLQRFYSSLLLLLLSMEKEELGFASRVCHSSTEDGFYLIVTQLSGLNLE